MSSDNISNAGLMANDDDLQLLDQYIREVDDRIAFREKQRYNNARENILYPNEQYLASLDSSIKKNSAFVKKIKNMTESQRDSLLRDIKSLNLTKFTSEIASSIVEAKYKLNDIPSVVEICSKLHQSYADFGQQLLEQWIHYLPSVKKQIQHESANASHIPMQAASGSLLYASNSSHVSSISANSDSSPTHASNKVSNLVSIAPTSSTHLFNPSKMRIDLRLFTELISSGIFSLKIGLPILINLLAYLTVHDKNLHQNANSILSFCRAYGEEYADLISSKIETLSEKYNRVIPKHDFVPEDRQTIIRNCLKEYYGSFCRHLASLYNEMFNMESQNKKIITTKGELSKDRKEKYESRQIECQKSWAIVQQFAAILNEPLPELPEAGAPVCFNDDVQTMNLDGQQNSSDTDNNSIWEDEDARNFYEGIPDFRSMFPQLVAKFNKSSSNEDLSSSERSSKLSTLEDDGDAKDSDSPIAEKIEINEQSNSPVSPTPSIILTQQGRISADEFFSSLSNCVNRNMIDKAAVDFVTHLNTKYGRKKLVKTLFSVQRTRLDLLPFYARLVAIIHPIVPSVGSEIVALLKQDFRILFRKKDQINIESKVKNVRFIGELVKFGLFSKPDALNCLKILLSDFTHHHIEMCCNLLETCGRMLYKCPESHFKLKLLLENMMRKKLLLSVDSRYITMIENAYYFSNPPEIVIKNEEVPPIHAHIQYLLYDCLGRSTIGTVLKEFEQLDWYDPNVAKFAIKCLINVHHVKFYNIRYAAALLADFNKFHDWVSPVVVDGVIENILLMMEINQPCFNQRRIPMIRFLGELYNYKVADASLVFKILYSLITYGVHYPRPDGPLATIPISDLDPPNNLFRLKLICDLLETCGQYMSSGQEKKKLDCYLLFFQRYYWSKRYIYTSHPYCMAISDNQFPVSVEYVYNDAITSIRPKFKFATSYVEAIEHLQNFTATIGSAA